MEIIVKLHGDFCKKAGTNSIKVTIGENETVDTLLMKLSRRHPQLVETILDPTTGELREQFNILLNGRAIQRLRGIHTKLKHRDEIVISPPEKGG
jgi:molybdopterin synthase sulfur carrier subunit